MRETIYSAGECPTCPGFGAVLFVKDLLSGRIFFLCPSCGVAWSEVPDSTALDSVDRPEKFAPTGIGLPTREEIDSAKIAGLIKEELDYDDWAEGLESYLGEQGGD